MKTHFSILDVGITVDAPDNVLQPIASAYRRFVTAEAQPGAILLEYRAGDPDRLQAGEVQIPIAGEVDATIQLYQHFLITLFDRVDSYAVLHGAALTDRRGDVFLLAGPSGHGKSSLSLELAQRGHGFLGDDYAPLDLDRGQIQPYPRAVALKPEGRAPIPDAFRQAAQQPSVDRLFEKKLVDVGQVLGESRLVGNPAPLRNVFILSDRLEDDERSENDTIHVTLHSAEADRFQAELSSIGGIEILQREDHGETRALLLRRGSDALSGKALAELLARDTAIVLSYRGPEAPPDFSSDAALASITRTQTALALCREMLNRRDGGRLLARFDDDPTALFVAVAAALRGARCWRLAVGRFEDTVAQILSVVDRD